MGKVQWLKRDVGFSGMSVESARDWPRVFVSLGGSHWRVTAAMHFVPELRRSLPHMEDHCEFCHFPATVKTFLPVSLSPHSYSRDICKVDRLDGIPEKLPPEGWPAKVLEIPPSAAQLLQGLDQGIVFAVWRGTGKDSKKVLWRVYTNRTRPFLPPFDVRPQLERCWGLRIPARLAGK
jgi:hypothetical protein